MYHIPVTYTSYNWKFAPFYYFHPIHPLLASGNQKSDLFFYKFVWLFVCFRSIFDIVLVPLYNIVIWYFYAFQNNHQNKSVTIKWYYIVVDYIPHMVHFIFITHLFCNWKFVPLNLLHLFLSSPCSSSFWQPNVSSQFLLFLSI